MSRPVTLVAWEDATKKPPGHPGAVWTDQGPAWCAHTPTKVGPWYPEPPVYGQPPLDPQPTVWCDPAPPGPDALTVAALKRIFNAAWRASAAPVEDLDCLRRALDALGNGGTE